MQNNKKIIKISGVVLIVIVLGALFYEFIYPAFVVKELDEKTPEIKAEVVNEEGKKEVNQEFSSSILAESSFLKSAHSVKGKAKIVHTPKELVLRFEDFDTINGPDLRVYLSSDLEATDFIDLGELKANKGNFNYSIPDGTDTTKYNKVLVYCRAYTKLFSYAALDVK